MRTSMKNVKRRIKAVGLALLMIITSLGTEFMINPMVVYAADKEISIPVYIYFYKATGELDSDGIAPELESFREDAGSVYAFYNADGQGGYVIESSRISVGDFVNDTIGNFDFSITMPAEEYAPAIEGYKFRGWGIDTSSSSSPRATSWYYSKFCKGNGGFSPIASNASITYDLQLVYQKSTYYGDYSRDFKFSELSTDNAQQQYSINVVPVYGELYSVEVNFSGSEINDSFHRVIYEDDLYEEVGTVTLPEVDEVVEVVDPNKEYYWVIENNVINEDWDIWSSGIYMDSAETQTGVKKVYKPGASLKITIVNEDDYPDEPYYPYEFRLESIDKSQKSLSCLLDENENGIYDQKEKKIQGTLESISYSSGDDYNDGAFGTYEFKIDIEDELESTISRTFIGWKYEDQIYKKGIPGSISINGDDMVGGIYQIQLTPDFEAVEPYSITHEGAIYENKGNTEESIAYPGSQVILSPETTKEGYSWALFTKSGEVLTYDAANDLEMELDGAKVSFTMPEADVVAKYLPVLARADMENGVNTLILSGGTQMILDGGNFGNTVTFREMSSDFTDTVEAYPGVRMILNVPGSAGVWYEATFLNDTDSLGRATFYYRDAVLTVADATSAGKVLTEVNTYLGEKFALTADVGEPGADLVSWMELDEEYPVSEMTSTSLPFSVVNGRVYYTVSSVASEITVKPVYRTKYTVTVDGVEIGRYAPGATVTLKPVSTAYKVFKGWKVTAGGVTITSNQFTMTSRSVEIIGEYDVYASSFAVGSALRLAKGVPYKFGSGKYKVNGDATTYMGGMTFYVSSEGEYTFTKE